MLSHDDKKAGLTVTSRLETTVVAGALCPRVREGGEPLVLFAEMSVEHSVPAALLPQEDARGHHVSVEGEGEGAVGSDDAAGRERDVMS